MLFTVHLQSAYVIKKRYEALGMDFNHRMMQPLPFYMTYPGYCEPGRDSTVLRDLEYLQQMYPLEVKNYQRKVAEILDKLDYEGSMIYDEYPDRYSLQRLTGSIIKMLQNEEKRMQPEECTSIEKWTWLENMIQVLLCNEIYKRRHGGRRGFFCM